VVAGGSVVTSDLPSGVIASGNPAVPVRNLKEFVAA
jgi:acetyltransferase-like isoleucine patch superfamily enzyme